MLLTEIKNENTKPDHSGFRGILDSVKLDLTKAGWRWQQTEGESEVGVDLSGIVQNLLGVNKVCTTCKYYYHKEFIQHNNMGICTEDDTSHMFCSNGVFNGDEFGCIRHTKIGDSIT